MIYPESWVVYGDQRSRSGGIIRSRWVMRIITRQHGQAWYMYVLAHGQFSDLKPYILIRWLSLNVQLAKTLLSVFMLHIVLVMPLIGHMFGYEGEIYYKYTTMACCFHLHQPQTMLRLRNIQHMSYVVAQRNCLSSPIKKHTGCGLICRF